ncbi:MAG: hypothetical protein LBM95_07330 [Lactobacillales bacterium]|jgi:hypothetical protein|nr:hypothetical protein [Lactobacillales bacterium]
MGRKFSPLPGEVLRGRSLDLITNEIKRYINGWLNYYGICEMKGFMNELNGWVKRRIRQLIWKQWKNPRTRRRNPIRLGIEKHKTYEWSNTRKRYWHISASFILHRSLTDKELASLGYEDISLRYQFVHSNYRTVVYGSVRGELFHLPLYSIFMGKIFQTIIWD